MRKKLFLIIGLLILFGIIILFIFNSRYPFINPAVGNWSVGFSTTVDPLDNKKLAPINIISYEYIDSIVPGPVDYIADPFFLKDQDTFYLFVELKSTEKNADIALLTSPDGLNYEYEGVVLDENFHLSYPQVFRHKENFYMLPETKGSNNVLLYKAENFPYGWKVKDTLIRNKGLKDPSILLSKNLNLIVAVDDNLKQYMFSADSLEGEWKEVEKYEQRWGNESRPGGRFFNVKGEWYLPMQNRSLGYGTGISLYRLEENNKMLRFKLAEKLFLKPQPHISWFNRGMHHLDIQQIGETYYMVYDGDRNPDGKQEFQYKRTLKFNYMDFYNFIVN